jgi:hypothetical protein
MVSGNSELQDKQEYMDWVEVTGSWTAGSYKDSMVGMETLTSPMAQWMIISEVDVTSCDESGEGGGDGIVKGIGWD